MPPARNEGECLGFPIFHGTSSLFADSILRAGLGAKNVIAEMKAFEFLAIAKDLCKEFCNLESDNQLGWRVSTAETFLRQKFSRDGMNFRHGQAYFTPSITQAAQYAKSNCVGSELISLCVHLYQSLSARDMARGTKHSSRLALLSPRIAALRPENHIPVIIEASAVAIDTLAGESDQDVSEQIRKIEGCRSQERLIFEITTSQMNFRLTRPPIPPSQQKAHRVIEWDIERDRFLRTEPYYPPNPELSGELSP